ncbi:MAG: COX15/CtaA family protein [Candidatus Marinimicrobia bacterium]|nr:COX15/CtaA family protein [Candidatus Neomarinimicrobiota bacterium]MBL7011091.1 COX15/CtaA family protein [Candidatus Neomarinimicrobiota bacterium]MBL7029537.1 COX15/CtaA family protein [Candidatus Neomarinimicrobiota bacterium]
MKSQTQPWLRRLSKLTVFSTLFLIFAGALVKSHEVGLSVPDWPTTYGKQMFAYPISEMVGGIFYEHGHRMIATIVGFFTMVQAIWLGFSQEPPWLKKLGYLALGTVILQGLFGGITVLFFLPPPVSIIHGILAQTFFMTTIVIAYGLSIERFNRIEISWSSKIKRGAIIMGGFVYIQLILGALMRHTASGMAIPDFPMMGGLWIPTFSSTMLNNINVTLFDMDRDMVTIGQVIIHFIHRLGAVIVTGTIAYYLFRYYSIIQKDKLVYFTFWGIVAIVLTQFTLGAVTVLTERSPYIASYHVATGAALLGICTLFALRVNPIKWSEWRSN